MIVPVYLRELLLNFNYGLLLSVDGPLKFDNHLLFFRVLPDQVVEEPFALHHLLQSPLCLNSLIFNLVLQLFHLVLNQLLILGLVRVHPLLEAFIFLSHFSHPVSQVILERLIVLLQVLDNSLELTQVQIEVLGLLLHLLLQEEVLLR